MSVKYSALAPVLFMLLTACARPGPHAPVPAAAPSFCAEAPDRSPVTERREANASAPDSEERAGPFEPPGIRQTPLLPPSTAENNPLVRQGPGPTQPALPDVLPPGIMRPYQRFRYDEVIALAQLVLLDQNASSGQQVRALVLAGAAWYLKGRPDKAVEAFHKALAREPSIRLNEEVFPREMIRLFEETRNAERNSMAPVQQPGRDSAHKSPWASLYKQGQTLTGEKP